MFSFGSGFLAKAPSAAKRRRIGDDTAPIKARPPPFYQFLCSVFAPVKKEGLFFFSSLGTDRWQGR